VAREAVAGRRRTHRVRRVVEEAAGRRSRRPESAVAVVVSGRTAEALRLPGSQEGVEEEACLRSWPNPRNPTDRCR